MREREDKYPLPIFVARDDSRDFADIDDREFRAMMIKWHDKMKSGIPFLDELKESAYSQLKPENFQVSKCFNCNDISIWIYDSLVYPRHGEAPPSNPDLSKEIRRDYEEASAILELSPRGAAALVRLCIQKLCKELGQPGKNINHDIAALVKAGLDSRIQKALDAVRVIGNTAVHPGSIDLRDDRATAESLFGLLNLIAEKMISEPKHVDQVYASLPPKALAAIEARDK